MDKWKSVPISLPQKTHLQDRLDHVIPCIYSIYNTLGTFYLFLKKIVAGGEGIYMQAVFTFENNNGSYSLIDYI